MRSGRSRRENQAHRPRTPREQNRISELFIDKLLGHQPRRVLSYFKEHWNFVQVKIQSEKNSYHLGFGNQIIPL